MKAPDLRHSTSTLLQMTHHCHLSFSGSWQDGSKVNTWAVNVPPVLDSISEKELFYRVGSQYLSAMLSDLHLNTAKERYLLLVASLFSSAFMDFPSPQKSTSSSSSRDTSTSWVCLTCRTLGCFTSTSHRRFMGSQWAWWAWGEEEGRGGDGGEERRRRRSQPGWGAGSRAAHRSAGRQEALRWPAATRADSRNVEPSHQRTWHVTYSGSEARPAALEFSPGGLFSAAALCRSEEGYSELVVLMIFSCLLQIHSWIFFSSHLFSLLTLQGSWMAEIPDCWFEQINLKKHFLRKKRRSQGLV